MFHLVLRQNSKKLRRISSYYNYILLFTFSGNSEQLQRQLPKLLLQTMQNSLTQALKLLWLFTLRQLRVGTRSPNLNPCIVDSSNKTQMPKQKLVALQGSVEYPTSTLTPSGSRFPACPICLSLMLGESQMALGVCVMVPHSKVRITLCSEVVLRKSLNCLNCSSSLEEQDQVYSVQ